jgi:hypothetical protein
MGWVMISTPGVIMEKFKNEDYQVCPYCFAQRVIYIDELELGKYIPKIEDRHINAGFECGTYIFENIRYRQSIKCLMRQRDNLRSEKWALRSRIKELCGKLEN